MRKRFEQQLRMGVTPIEKLDLSKVRGAQGRVLNALQWIFVTPEVNGEIFELLESRLSEKIRKSGD